MEEEINGVPNLAAIINMMAIKLGVACLGWGGLDVYPCFTWMESAHAFLASASLLYWEDSADWRGSEAAAWFSEDLLRTSTHTINS